MKKIDVRPKQNEKGRRSTHRENYYIHPKSKYIGMKVNGGFFTNGKPCKDWYCFVRETKKLFTLNQLDTFKSWGYGDSIANSASNCREWYKIRIPSTGWQKIQFIFHEPITFKEENPLCTNAHFLKFLLNEI
jgi:hypothetical protein